MALNLSVLQQPLHSIEVPDPLVRRAKVAQLADIEAQARQRQTDASKDQLAVQKAAALEQALSGATWDSESGMPDKATMQKIFAIDPAMHAGLTEHYTSAATAVKREAREQTKTQSDLDTADQSRKKTAWDILKEQQAQTAKQAQDAAGTIIPGTEDVYDVGGIPTRGAMYRVLQPDGKTYKDEFRQSGKAAAAPVNPPQPTPPMSPQLFEQRKGLAKITADAAAARTAAANPGGTPDSVSYWADQIESNPLNISLIADNKTLKQQVRDELSVRGRDVNRLTAATRQLGETADTVVPKIDALIKKLDNPKFVENLGPVMGRWNEFWTGQIGTNDPDLAALRAQIGLTQTGVMRAHVGARGGEGMLQKFESLADSKKMDAATLKGSLTGVRDFLQGYRDKIHPVKTPVGQRGLIVPGGALEKLLQGQQ